MWHLKTLDVYNYFKIFFSLNARNSNIQVCLDKLLLLDIMKLLTLIYIIGQSKCKWGRVEWCASAANAKRCHKTNYCMRFKWFKPTHNPGSMTTSSSSSSFSKLPSLSIGKRCHYPSTQWCSSYKIAKACNVSISYNFRVDRFIPSTFFDMG